MEKNIIKIPVKKFEVYKDDCYCKLSFDDAKKYCESLGDGWRLPTRKEQLEMYDYKEELGLKHSIYWSSTEYSTTNAFNFYFIDGYAFFSLKFNTNSVRAVRTIK